MEIVDRLDDFIRSYYDTELVKASSGDKALIIDFSAFDRFDPLLADQLLEDPENTIKVFDEAASRIANDTVRVRVRNLPESRGIRIRNLRAKHLGKFLSIDAIIKAASEVRPQIYEAVFVCPECSTKLTLPQETNIVQKPTQCECGRRGDFKMLGTKMYDIRWLTAIEPFEITSGEQAGQISIMLKEDLTTPKMQKKTDPGSRLRISGILKELPKRIKGKMSTKMDMYVLANHVETSEIEFDDLEITPEEEKIIKDFSADPNIYEKLIASIAPGIYGFDDIKESIVLQLFGGVPHTLPDGSRIRGNIHILLTGDPGVGKSVSGESAILHNSDAGPEFTTVGELINRALEKHKIRDESGAEISLKNETGIRVLTLNPDNGAVEWKPVTAFIRHTSPETMIKVTTRSGREITATACHSFVHMDSDGNIKSIRGDELNDNVYLPIPIGSQKELLSEISTGAQKKTTNAKLLPQKIKLDWNFGFFLGMFVAEGSCSGGHANIESRNAERRKLVKSFIDGLGLNAKEMPEGVRVPSRRLVSLLRELCYDKRISSKPGIKGSGAVRKKIPDFCFFGTDEFIKGLLSGLFSGDGYFVNVQPKNGRTKPNLKIGFETVSKPLAYGLLELLSLMGIFAKIRKKPYTYKGVQKESYEILILGAYTEKLLSQISMVGKNKSVERFSQKDSFDVLPCTNLLYEIVKSLNFSSKKHAKSYQRRSFAAMMRTVKSRGRAGRRRIERIYEYLAAEAEKTKNPKAKQLLPKLRRILDMPVVWDQVKTIEAVPRNEKYVYDLSVDGNETFVANNLVVHNTVLLKLVSTIVPRGRYVSGSGVSGAGLCTTYDTMIVLDDGKIRKIGELVEEKSSKLEEVETGMLNCDGDGLKVMALDQKTLKIRPMKITKYWKIKSPKSLVKITTRSGKEIRVTKNNPMPIIENGELLWKYAKDMNAHEYIACPRKLTCNVDNKIRLEVDTTARLVNCGETVSNMLEKIREKGSIKDFIEETGVSKQGLYWWWKNENSAPTIQTLEIIGSKLGINVYDLLPEEMILTQHRGTFIKLPKNLNEEIMYFFGLIAGDGDIAETGYGGFSLRFHSASHELLDKFSHICRNNFGTEPEYYKHPERIAYMRINSKILGKIAQLLGIPSGKKSQRLTVTELLSGLPDNLVAAYLRGLFDTDGCVVERNTRGANYVEFTTASKELAYGISLLLLRFDVVSKIRKRAPSVSEIKGRKVISKGKYQIEIKGLNNLTTFRELLGFNFSGKKSKLDKIIAKISSANTNVDVIPSIASLLRKARLSSGFTSKDLYGYKSYAFERGLMNPSRNMAISIVNKFDNKDAKNEFINKLRILANSDIFWDEVKSVESVAGEDYVYDLTVEEEHSFVANGMIIHNTATVVKNEAIGGWVLEAGALILCNKGLISIDEFDKMSRDDQIAMHEATSVETVSIAKASIVATLPAQTAVLAGANPKLGRFDPYVPITEQINIPETLLSRFDLKFALRDIPDRVRDEKIAGHVITSRTTPDFVEPPINTHLLRKYIAYAKSATNVELLPEASELLKNFYVEMRNQYPSEGVQPVSITLRQYEALIRLAEASAKVRLDTKVRLHDAERAVRLMKVSLYQLGYDIETGKIDIDRMESGVTASKRRKIGIILEILEKLQKELGHEVQKEDLKAETENQGIVEGVDDIIDRLIREGTIFEPRPGFIRRV